MFVGPHHPVLDQEYPYKQRFILQVCWGFLSVTDLFIFLLSLLAF
jgi:hypothetical protein